MFSKCSAPSRTAKQIGMPQGLIFHVAVDAERPAFNQSIYALPDNGSAVGDIARLQAMGTQRALVGARVERERNCANSHACGQHLAAGHVNFLSCRGLPATLAKLELGACANRATPTSRKSCKATTVQRRCKIEWLGEADYFIVTSIRWERKMRVDDKNWRPIWLESDGWRVGIIDQTRLPFSFVTVQLETEADAAHAIRDMLVRGAPLIGATAAYGMALAMREDSSDSNLGSAYGRLLETRPTAINLKWALDDMAARLRPLPASDRVGAAYRRAFEIVEEDVEINRSIGAHGLPLLREIAERKGRVNVLTHCNAGWLATCDWGTATSPVYQAHDAGIDVHVWVDETRPRNQGGHLTAWELQNHGVPHTVIVDNAGGHLMQRGEVDICLVGTDRTTVTGDVCNKIGTYLKALAAEDNGVPFYVCLPSPTIDWTVRDGLTEIPIEERAASEVTDVTVSIDGNARQGRVVSPGSPAANPAFDVTPARLVTGLITERGVAKASEDGIKYLFPERKSA